MKICFVNPHSDPLAKVGEPDSGGQCVVEKELMKHFAEMSGDIEVDSYTRWWGEKPKKETIANGANVYRIECGGKEFIPKENLWEYLPEFVDNVMSFWEENNLNYDICHAHYADGGKVGVLLTSRKRVPLIFTAHSLGKLKREVLPDESKYRYSIRVPVEEEVMAKADKIIALNTPEAKKYEEFYDVTPPKLVVIPNGVDLREFNSTENRNEIRKKLGWTNKRVVFTAGRIDSRKGFDLLADAIPQVVKLLELRGEEPLFLFPGGGELSDNEKSVICEVKNSLGKYERFVSFFPRLTDSEMKEYYKAADLFVCPSPYEPFGLVVIEAFANNTPVVAFKSGGPAEIITDNVDGILADIHKKESLALAIDKVLFDEKNRIKMGKCGREKVEKCYSWGAIAKQTIKLYQEVISGNL